MPKSSPKVAVDTSALISLAHADLIDLILEAFDVVISEQIFEELNQTAQFQDDDGMAARQILNSIQRIDVRPVDAPDIQVLITSRIHEGEASCIILAQEKDVGTLISDDFRAMHQLQYHARSKGFDLGFGAVLIRALILRGKLSHAEALDKLNTIASKRNWIERPIYSAYRQLLKSSEL